MLASAMHKRGYTVNLLRTIGARVKTTSAMEYINMIRTPGHKSQYLGEGLATYNSGSEKDMAT